MNHNSQSMYKEDLRRNSSRVTSQKRQRLESESLDLLIQSFGSTEIQQMLKAHANGTQEVKNTLENECTIIFECRQCGSFYRSVELFLLHKESFCNRPIVDSYPEHKCKKRNLLSTRSTLKDCTDLVNFLKNVTQNWANTNLFVADELPEGTRQAPLNKKCDPQASMEDVVGQHFCAEHERRFDGSETLISHASEGEKKHTATTDLCRQSEDSSPLTDFCRYDLLIGTPVNGDLLEEIHKKVREGISIKNNDAKSKQRRLSLGNSALEC